MPKASRHKVSGGSRESGRPPPQIDWMHLKTCENSARKCMHKIFKKVSGEGTQPTPDTPHPTFPPPIPNSQIRHCIRSRHWERWVQ